MTARYYVSAEGHYWVIRDRENSTELPTGHSIGGLVERIRAETEMGNVKPGAWAAAYEEAVHRAYDLNEEAGA